MMDCTDPVSGSVDSASLSPSHSIYLQTQSNVSNHMASSSPSTRRPSSYFDAHNEQADARENVVVADRHANVRASAVMPDDDNEFALS